MNLLFSILPLAIKVPAQMTTTIDNILTALQIIGGSLAGVFLGIAAIQFMSGGRNAVEMTKTKIVCIVVGMVVLAGSSVIKVFIQSLIAF